MTTTHKIISDIKERIENEIKQALDSVEYDWAYEHADDIYVTIQYPCGTIELVCEINDEWCVYIDNSTAHTLPRLHEEIKKALPAYEYDFDEARAELRREAAAWNDTMRSLNNQFI